MGYLLPSTPNLFSFIVVLLLYYFILKKFFHFNIKQINSHTQNIFLYSFCFGDY